MDEENKEKSQVFGNESFGIPKDYTKKQKFSALKLVCYVVIVAVVCLCGYNAYQMTTERFLPTVTFDKSQQPLIYQRLSHITMKNSKSEQFSAGAVSGDLEVCVKTAEKGNTVFFISDNNELCVRSLTGDEKGLTGTVVIDTDVTDFKINSDGKFVVYRKGDSLYVSNLEDTRIIATDVSDYYLSKNNQKIVFYKTDNSIYTCGTTRGETPVLVDRGITKIISEKSNYSTIYYIKNSILYKKEFDSPRIIISENVIDAIMLGDFVYFTTEELYEKRFTDIFYDDVSITDAKLDYPKPDDFISTVSGASLFDAEGYQEALAEYENKLLRDKIRGYYLENPAYTTGYSLYLYERDDNKRIDTYLQYPYLTYNSCRDAVLYRRYDTNIYRPKTSKLESLDAAIAVISASLKASMDTDIYLLKKDRKPYHAFEEFPAEQVVVSLDAKYVYCIENEKQGFGTLVRYEAGNRSLHSRVAICEDISDFFVDGADSATVIAFSGDKVGIYTEEKYTHLSDKSCREFFFVDGVFFYYDDYDYTLKTGTLKTLRNGKASVVDTGVHCFDVRNYNTVAYIKNFNPDMNVGNLYIKSGRVKKKEDICVAAIIN